MRAVAPLTKPLQPEEQCRRGVGARHSCQFPAMPMPRPFPSPAPGLPLPPLIHAGLAALHRGRRAQRSPWRAATTSVPRRPDVALIPASFPGFPHHLPESRRSDRLHAHLHTRGARLTPPPKKKGEKEGGKYAAPARREHPAGPALPRRLRPAQILERVPKGGVPSVPTWYQRWRRRLHPRERHSPGCERVRAGSRATSA